MSHVSLQHYCCHRCFLSNNDGQGPTVNFRGIFSAQKPKQMEDFRGVYSEPSFEAYSKYIWMSLGSFSQLFLLMPRYSLTLSLVAVTANYSNSIVASPSSLRSDPSRNRGGCVPSPSRPHVFLLPFAVQTYSFDHPDTQPPFLFQQYPCWVLSVGAQFLSHVLLHPFFIAEAGNLRAARLPCS